MHELVEHRLTDLLAHVVDNRGRTCPTSETGTPLIATNCVKDEELYPVFGNIRFVDASTYDTWFRGHPQPGDIVFVCKGSPGRVALVPDPVSFCIAQDMVALRADPEIINNRYLYYLLTSPDTRRKIENMHVGTMIPHFKKGDFHKLLLPVHKNLDVQSAIAEVLGALDDKIEANAKLSKMSLNLARSLFLASIASTDAVEVTLASSCNLLSRGIAPKYSNEANSMIVLNQKCVREHRVNIAPSRRTLVEKVRPDKVLLRNDVLVNFTGQGTLGRVARWTQNGSVTADSHITIVRFNPELVDPVCGGFALLLSEARITEMAAGSTGQTELSRKELGKLKLLVPPREQQLELGRQLADIADVENAYLQENNTLKATRDALLPQLMSGKLHVKDVESIVETLV